MYDDPIGALEAELLAAARRRAHRTRRARSWSVGGVLTAAAAVGALIVAIGAVALLGRHGGGANRVGSSRTVTSRSITFRSVVSVGGSSALTLEGSFHALIGTVADGSPAGAELTQSVFRQLGLARYPREAFTAGAVKVPGNVRIELWEVVALGSAGADHDQLVAVVAGRVVARAPAAQVRRRGLLLAYGQSRSGTRVAVVVPNRVARVELSVSGGPSMLAPVRHNIATFELRVLTLVRSTRLTWYGRNGRGDVVVAPLR
jgi:hypothetical protein